MGVPHVERNIGRDAEAREEFLEKGYDSLPVVEIGESVIMLYTGEALLIEVLAGEGYL